MATTVTPPAESSPAVAVPTEPQAYADWRMTGKLPAEPKPEASATSKKSSDAGDKPAEGARASEKAPESETGKPQEQHKRGAETRLNELLDDLRRAGLSPAELKTFKREAQRQQAEPQKAAPEHTEKPAGLEPPKKPDPAKFEGTWEELEAARDKYYEDLAEYKAKVQVREYQERQQRDTAQREFDVKMKAAHDRYGEDAESTIGTAAKAIFGDQQIPAAVKAVLNDSPVPVDLLYVMGSKSEEFQEFLSLARTNPGAAIRRAVLIERLVIDELAKGGKPDAGASGEDGKFSAQKAPEKKTTEAPPPPKEVSGRGAAPADAVESAATDGDFRRYRSAANRRDIAHRQGR